ncbi:unnamed protein product [Protopolystoma xenopodis]|uniref:Uncharacterized protein n=1 Tax=Protopolystoma xenopodis TaxID=117903 RepID=A0A3S5BP07_9PLAT|nr:unnamed protein product [Protopolystoma xenopodis]
MGFKVSYRSVSCLFRKQNLRLNLDIQGCFRSVAAAQTTQPPLYSTSTSFVSKLEPAVSISLTTSTVDFTSSSVSTTSRSINPNSLLPTTQMRTTSLFTSGSSPSTTTAPSTSFVPTTFGHFSTNVSHYEFSTPAAPTRGPHPPACGNITAFRTTDNQKPEVYLSVEQKKPGIEMDFLPIRQSEQHHMDGVNTSWVELGDEGCSVHLHNAELIRLHAKINETGFIFASVYFKLSLNWGVDNVTMTLISSRKRIAERILMNISQENRMFPLEMEIDEILLEAKTVLFSQAIMTLQSYICHRELPISTSPTISTTSETAFTTPYLPFSESSAALGTTTAISECIPVSGMLSKDVRFFYTFL